MKLFDDEAVTPEEVLAHPRHQAAQLTLVKLIEQLRACSNVEEGYAFQQELLGHVLAVEEDRNALSQVVKRLAAGRKPQVGAPQPQSGRDPEAPETWQLEHDLCERVARQYRCVGDALAWRVFGFDRSHILALSRNQSPGVMAGKKGLARERETVEQAYTQDGRFALMHDLTNCLRIGDVTVFTDEGPVTDEVKNNPEKERRSTPQTRRIEAARRSLGGRDPLPGGEPCHRLHALDVSLQTHLDLLALGADRAVRDGIFATRVPGNRMLLVVDLLGCQAQGWTEAEFNERLVRQAAAARRRAKFNVGYDWIINATSLDSVSRDPRRVPFAAYPLHPVICARLIGDICSFVVESSGPGLAEALNEAGLAAQWTRPPDTIDLAPGEVVMEIVSKTVTPMGMQVREDVRTLQMRRSELDRYLIELVDQRTWTTGIRSLMFDPKLSGQPWPYYRDEYLVWA